MKLRVREILDELDTIAANIAIYDPDNLLGAQERAEALIGELREILE